MWSIKTLAKVFLVEPHGGDNAARGPIDHDVCQQVIQRELPATHDPTDIKLLTTEKLRKQAYFRIDSTANTHATTQAHNFL